METKKKVILFDFDGVLIDTLGICYAINTKVNADLSLEEYQTFFEGNIHTSVRKDGTARVRHPEFFQEYDLHTREVIIPPILKQMVRNLSEKYILTVVSSTGSDSIQSILEREGLAECFSWLLGSDVHTSKVVKNKMVLEKYAVTPEQTIFITDTLGDIREASECGIDSVAITWGFHSVETLQKGNPKVIVSDPAKLQEEIENILK